MKRNAIARIIIWSIVIVMLSGILITGISWDLLSFRRRSSDTSAVQAGIGETEISADEVNKISIEWVSGRILIRRADVSRITFSESAVTDPKYTMVWKQKGNNLIISFCDGIAIRENISKDLLIYVPMDWVCDELEIDAASASVEVTDLTVRKVDFDGASGVCTFTNCIVDKLDLDTASGDFTFTGELNTLDCDAASANVYAVFTNVPDQIEMDSMSGNLDITLPQNAGFAVSIDGISSDFSTDFDVTARNGSYICGDGHCRIQMEAMSGDVTVRSDSSTAVPNSTGTGYHRHTDACKSDPDSCPDNQAGHHHGKN